MDFVATLLRTGAPAIAASFGRPHPVSALWPANDLAALDGYLASGKRSVFGWGEICQARVAEFQASLDAIDPFLNVNTPDDLRTAEQASVAHRTEIGPP
jgi:molybdopterin-guanine dinucleotide biosynthesis protein A